MKRNANFELFRIIAMFMITVSHLLGQGGVFVNTTVLEMKIALHFIESICNVAVNYFVLLAGYFMIRGSMGKLIKLLMQIQFYSLMVQLLALIKWDGNSLFFHAKEGFFPILLNQWWYMTCYVVLFLLSPLLNRMLEEISQTMLRHGVKLALILFVVFPTCSQLMGQSFLFGSMGDGFTVSHFIVVYCLGYYVAHYGQHWSKKGCLAVYMGSTAVICAINVWRDMKGQPLWYSYNNVFIIMQAITMLLLVKNLKLFGKKAEDHINRIASLTLAVYLLSNHKMLREWLYLSVCKTDQFYNSPMQIPMLLISALCILIVCMVIEAVRQYLDRRLKISERVTQIVFRLPWVQKVDKEYFLRVEVEGNG